MANPTAILRRVNRAFSRLNPPSPDKVYKRVVTRTGGDDLTGRPGSVTNTDTLLSPQPIYSRPMREEIGLYRTHTLLAASTGVEPAANWVMTVSPTAMSINELSNKDMLIVTKDVLGNEEVFLIQDYETTGFSGVDILYDVRLKSIKR
jgi:hypothetical protein